LLLIVLDFVLVTDETLDNYGEHIMVIVRPFPAASIMFYNFTPKHCFPNSSVREPLLALRIIKDPQIFAQVNVVFPYDRYSTLKIYTSEMISDRCEYTQLAYVKMHCMIRPD
jgi:hypothetical protein